MEVDALTSELNKIVTAPYLVSLKRLHNILRGRLPDDSSVIYQWVRMHHKDIHILASAIVQGLSQWPYVLDIVEQLSSVRAFRDSLFEASPSLLNHLLSKAVESDSLFDQYAPICLSLLREPLPDGIPLPSAAETLLWKFFGLATRTPNSTTVEPVYLLLDGGCQGLLDIFPNEGLDKLRNHLTNIMRNAKGIEEQSLSLLCLTIIAKTIYSSRDCSTRRPDTSAEDISKHGNNCITKEAERFFIGERASKTLHLLALQVIYACRIENTTSQLQRLQLVRLARGILNAVDRDQREIWTKNNHSIVKKLHEKIIHEQLPLVVQFEALAFSSTLFYDATKLPNSVIECFQTAFPQLDSIVHLGRYLGSAVSTALSFFAPCLNECFWQNFFQIYLSRITNNSQNTLLDHHWLTELLPILEMACSNCDTTRVNVVNAVSQSNVHKAFENYTSQEFRTSNVLLHDLCASLLRITAVIQKEEPDLGTSLKLKLVTLLQQPGIGSESPSTFKIHPMQTNPLSLAEQTCTPDELGASHNWRRRLSFEFRSEMVHRKESMIRIISEVCRDLEVRCENVEEPLRAKQAEFDELNNSHAKLQARTDKLELDLADNKSEILIVKAAYTRVELEHTEALSDNAKLHEKNLEMEELLQRTKDEAEQTLINSLRDFESQKLALQATLACRMENIDEYAKEISNLQLRLGEIEADAKEDKARAAELQTCLEETISDLRASNEIEVVARSDKNRALEKSKECQTALEGDIARLQNEIYEVSTRLKESEDIRRDSERTYHQNIDDLKLEHKRALSGLQSQAVSEKESYERRLQGLQAEITGLKENYDVQMHQEEQEKQNLQQKIMEFAEECQDKTNRLEEAQHMKSRLLSALGLNEQAYSLPKNSPGNHAAQISMVNKPRRTRTPQISPHTSKIFGFRADESNPDRGIELEGNLIASHKKSPKRAKPRTTVHVGRAGSERIAKSSQTSSSVRTRRSTDTRALGDRSLESLNATRRQSENAKLQEAFADAGSSTQSEGGEISGEQTLHKVTPDGQENPRHLYSTGDTSYGGLAVEDFDASTGEL